MVTRSRGRIAAALVAALGGISCSASTTPDGGSASTGTGGSNGSSGASTTATSTTGSSTGTSGTSTGSSSSLGASSTASGGSGSTAATGSSSGLGGSSSGGACAGTPIFCDDYTDPTLASAYTTYNGTWVRAVGSYTATDPTAWQRAQATLSDDITDFDLTIMGNTEGDYGFGIIYAALPDENQGYAVLVHPAQFQSIYLKQLVAGQGDTNLASTPLPAGLAGTPMTLRVVRTGSQVQAWLNGTQMINASDNSNGASGRLGLLLSATNLPANAGAVFNLFRVDSATNASSGSGSSSGGSSSSGSSSSGSGSSSSSGGGSSSGGATDGGTSGGDGGSPSGVPMPVGNITGWTWVWGDDFLGNAINQSAWGLYSGFPSHDDQQGSWLPSHVVVDGGVLYLRMYQDPAAGPDGGGGADGPNTYTLWTGGGVQNYGYAQTYGRYLTRMRCTPGAGVSCIALLWPNANIWPPEIDYYEDSPTTNTRTSTTMTAHYGAANNNPQVQCPTSDGYDFTQWHTVGVDWLSTTITYTIDGNVIGSIANPDTNLSDPYNLAQAMNNGFQIQVGDGTFPTSSTPAEVDMEIDWFVMYSPN